MTARTTSGHHATSHRHQARPAGPELADCSAEREAEAARVAAGDAGAVMGASVPRQGGWGASESVTLATGNRLVRTELLGLHQGMNDVGDATGASAARSPGASRL